MSPVNEDVAATAKKLESILDHNLWPGFDKFKLVQVRADPPAAEPPRSTRSSSPRDASLARALARARRRSFARPRNVAFSSWALFPTLRVLFSPHAQLTTTDPPLSPCLVSPQGIIDRNKVLIHEINRNHDARYIHPEGLHRNVDLIRELNANMLKAQELYEAAGGEFYQHAAISRARKPRAKV